jgi:hypothetical protein
MCVLQCTVRLAKAPRELRELLGAYEQQHDHKNNQDVFGWTQE